MNPRFVDSLLDQINAVIETSIRVGIYYPSGKPPAQREVQQLLTMCEAVIARLGSLDCTHTKHAQQLLASGGADTYVLDRMLGILQSLKISVANGYLENAEELIHGEVFDDFVEMADHLLSEGYKDASAVIVGSALEAHLRNLCGKNQIPTLVGTKKGDRPKKADQMNNNLASCNAYGKLDQKNVTAWLDLRNKAAHGEYDEYNKEQVSLMLMGVRGFIGRYPA